MQTACESNKQKFPPRGRQMIVHLWITKFLLVVPTNQATRMWLSVLRNESRRLLWATRAMELCITNRAIGWLPFLILNGTTAQGALSWPLGKHTNQINFVTFFPVRELLSLVSNHLHIKEKPLCSQQSPSIHIGSKDAYEEKSYADEGKSFYLYPQHQG